MTQPRHILAMETKVKPRLLNRHEASLYVGLSPNTFDRQVAAGTFPAPFPLTGLRRRLWDVRALDAAIDRVMGIKAKDDDWEASKRKWQQRKDRAQTAR